MVIGVPGQPTQLALRLVEVVLKQGQGLAPILLLQMVV